MLDPVTMMLIGSAIGLGKSKLIDEPKEKKQRELAAKTQELSPWTGMRATPIQEADPFGAALQYGATGLSMNRQMKYDDAMEKALNRGEYGSVLKSDGGWNGINTGGLSREDRDYLRGGI